MTATKLSCYNRGCGQEYVEAENSDVACQYHEGVPEFHDALKGWTCCKKRVTDFTDFLAIKGCCVGKHSNVKPVIPEKTPEQIEDEKRRSVPNRAPIDEKLAAPRPKATPPVRVALDCHDKLRQTAAAAKAKWVAEKEAAMRPPEVKEGDLCKNNACGKEYKGVASNSETCMFHDGQPVFHEGFKFWSCCEKKTHDFDVFLAQAGCTAGKHVWYKPPEELNPTVDLRQDFFQTGDKVTVTIFSKAIDPELVAIDVGNLQLRAHLVTCQGQTYELDVELFAEIDVASASARLLSTKLEISFKKKEIDTWTSLDLKS